jgi:hypothetical protein
MSEDPGVCFVIADDLMTYIQRLKVELVGSPETSVSNHLTRRKNPEDGRIYFNHSVRRRSFNVRVFQQIRTNPIRTKFGILKGVEKHTFVDGAKSIQQSQL